MWRPGGDCHVDITARAGDVFDEELLAESLGELLQDDAPDDVGRAAGRERHDYLHRMIGIAAGAEAGRGRDSESRQKKRNPKTTCCLSPAHSIPSSAQASISVARSPEEVARCQDYSVGAVSLSTGTTSFTAPRQPLCVKSKMTPSGLLYLTS